MYNTPMYNIPNSTMNSFSEKTEKHGQELINQQKILEILYASELIYHTLNMMEDVRFSLEFITPEGDKFRLTQQREGMGDKNVIVILNEVVVGIMTVKRDFIDLLFQYTTEFIDQYEEKQKNRYDDIMGFCYNENDYKLERLIDDES